MKNKINHTIIILAALLLCTGSISGHAQSYGQDTDTSVVQPDNTRVNVRDRNANELTADQQAENEADRDITQQIRKLIMADKSLSSYAHNIKIISQGGVVTMKGPVRSEREKQSLVEKALTVTESADKVVDEISIKRARK